MPVDVDRRYRIAAQCSLFQPGLIASRGQGVVVAATPEVDPFDLADAEVGAITRHRGYVVRWSNERTDRTGTPRVKANPAQGPDVSHGAPGPRSGLYVLAERQSCMFDMLPRTGRRSAWFAETRTVCRVQGVVIAPRPDMIVLVNVEHGATHAPLALGGTEECGRAF